MNFISETLANLSSGGKLYVVFQLLYITMGLFALYIFIKLYRVLNKIEAKLKKD